MLYNLIQCPPRITMDMFEDSALKDSVNPFVQLLWERGNGVPAFLMPAAEMTHSPGSPLCDTDLINHRSNEFPHPPMSVV